MKVAIVHYWFVTWRGGERVIEQLLRLFPDADVFCHVVDPEIEREHLAGHKVQTTFIGKLPGASARYQKLLPLMPVALEQLDLSGYDLVISSESGPAKNLLIGPDTVHICYCHSPMRYVWDMYHLYAAQAGRFTRAIMKPLMHYMRIADIASASRVDYFIANSKFTSRRIEKCYRRDSHVIYPPVSLSDFECNAEKSEYYLMLGQLTAYKRPDLVVDAFIKSGRKLVVIGEGELLPQLRQRNSPNIQILGRQPFDTVQQHLSKARALVFPGVEDFGIVPLEAMASGTPVVAFGKGGALETVVDSDDPDFSTGVFFYQQTSEALNEALDRLENRAEPIQAATCRRRAEAFAEDRFRAEFSAFVDRCLSQHHELPSRG